MNNFYNPMDTSSSIRHRFDIEILRGKFIKITSILKDESTCKLWHRFDVEVSTWIPLSKSVKYHWVFLVEFSMSFRRRIEVTSLLVDSILSFSNIFCPREPILGYSGIVLSRSNFNNIDVITDIGTIGTIS